MTGRHQLNALILAPGDAELVTTGYEWVGVNSLADQSVGLPRWPTTFLVFDVAGHVLGTLRDTEVLPVRATRDECHAIHDHICIDGTALVHVSQFDEGSPDISDAAMGVWVPGGHAIHVGEYDAGVATTDPSLAGLIERLDRHQGAIRGLPDTPCITDINRGLAQ